MSTLQVVKNKIKGYDFLVHGIRQGTFDTMKEANRAKSEYKKKLDFDKRMKKHFAAKDKKAGKKDSIWF